jgi:hypothetical protein
VTVDGLQRRIAELTLAGDAAGLAALYSPDALVDTSVPQWRYQVTGAKAEPILRDDFDVAGRRVTVSRVTPFDGGVAVGRHIVGHTVYCTGVWDTATIARQAIEAPMVRR